MLKWSVNNIPEMITKEVGREVDREQEQVYKRGKDAKWKKIKCVIKFCNLGSKKQVKTIFITIFSFKGS
jgi:hypothetical protein